MGRSFLAFSSAVTSMNMEPTLRSAQVLKQEAESLGMEGKYIVQVAKIRAEAEEKRGYS